MKLFVVLACVAAVAVAGKTCQESRAEAIKRQQSGKLGVHIPECEENGDFKAYQCHRSAGMCFCVLPNGDRLSQSSRTLRTCNCIKHRHNAKSRGVLGVFIPVCNDDNGFYQKIQCHDRSCFCAHEVTGEPQSKKVPYEDRKSLPCFNQ